MFCDLVGSTELGRRLDPEELREVITTYQRACTDAVKRYDGHVAQYLGDGVLVYFGFPLAHEDDAERAVRAGLAIQAALADLNERKSEAGATSIAARVGIHSGLVVIGELGDGARSQPLALGDTLNVAARLEAVAEPGGVVISHTTMHLVPGLFVARSLGTPELKGIEDPIQVYAVDGGAGVSSRSGTADTLTPLAGREQELGQIGDRWKQVQAGHGQVVAVSGEAGIGKSRLIRALRDHVAETPHTVLEIRCSPYASGSAFQPVIELFEQGLGLDPGGAEEPEARIASLENGLGAVPGLSLPDVVPFVGALLGVPASERFPLPQIGPELQREKTLQALMAPILALEAQQPMVIVWEDLHWADPSTLELLGRLIDQTPTMHVLHVLAYRPDFEPPWLLTRSYICPLALTRLTQEDTRKIVESVAHAGPMPEGLLDEVVARADGVPLFAEELGRSVVESGLVVENDGHYEFRGRASDLTIPTTLQGSLMARLDRLSAAKHVAQIAATLGREFSYSLVEAVADVDVPTLRNGLSQLTAAEIIYQRGAPPESSYTFKHALIQDTAYESQLKSRRRELHARIARVLLEQFPQRVVAEPAIVARHCAEGGLVPEAITHFQHAAEQAIARLANSEAVEYLERALGLLETLPENAERTQQEIGLRMVLSGPQTSLLGYEDSVVLANLQHVDSLCDEIGEGPEQLGALIGLSVYNTTRGNLPTASGYAERILQIAEPLGIAELNLAGHMIVGSAAITGAPIPVACEHLTKALELAEVAVLPPPTAAYDIDPTILAHHTFAIALVLNGQPAKALEQIAEGERSARQLDHLNTLGSALLSSAIASYFLDDAAASHRYAAECVDRVRGRDFHVLESSALVFSGWSTVALGDSRGTAQVEEGIALAEKSGSMGGLVQLYETAADAFLLGGDYDRAMEFVEGGASALARTGELAAHEPQIRMLRAQILLESGRGDPAEVRKILLDSIDGWHAFESQWMEIRSLRPLISCAEGTDELADARVRLAAVCDGLTEAGESKRVTDARAFLELNGESSAFARP
jgi:class 3 adenylate cyclase